MTDVGANPLCCATCDRVAEEQASPERDSATHWWQAATGSKRDAAELRALVETLRTEITALDSERTDTDLDEENYVLRAEARSAREEADGLLAELRSVVAARNDAVGELVEARAVLAKARDASGQCDEIRLLCERLDAKEDELVTYRKALAEKMTDNETLRSALSKARELDAIRPDSALGKLAAARAESARQCTQDKIDAAYLAVDQAGRARDHALDELASAWRLLSDLIDEWSDATGFDVCFDCWSPHGEDTGTYDDDSFLCRSCQLERMKAGSG